MKDSQFSKKTLKTISINNCKWPAFKENICPHTPCHNNYISPPPQSKSQQTCNGLIVEQVGGVSLINRSTLSSKNQTTAFNFCLFRYRMIKVPKDDPVFS